MKIYEYANCSTCKKAVKFLEQKKLEFERIPIVEKPPSVKDLKTMLRFIEERGGSFKNLFNTSGQLYRELGISDKLKAGMTEAEAVKLLSLNGKLIKRPFLLSSDIGLIGFKEDEWKKALL